MANVRLENVRKVYPDGTVAVHGASFEAEDGEFVVLVGPSGCGKSTTLRMVAGLESITEGELFIGERRVNDVPPKDRDIAMVFQSYALYPHMTVRQNMGFGLQLRKRPKGEIDRRVQAAAEILAIEDLLDRKPKALSGGQRQRVALGRAIVREPQVFLFDEPLSNLDAKLRAGMRTELAALHSRLGATMLYVTHDQVEAMTMGDRIVVLHDGHVQQVASPMTLYDRPANRFVAGFIGSPSMNLFEGELHREDGTLHFKETEGAFSTSLSALLPAQERVLEQRAGQGVTLGVRPEHFSLEGSGPQEEAASAVRVRAVLEVVEPMGSETILHARPEGGQEMQEAPVVAKVEPAAAKTLAAGQTVALVADPEKIHFFDAESGTALRTEAEQRVAT